MIFMYFHHFFSVVIYSSRWIMHYMDELIVWYLFLFNNFMYLIWWMKKFYLQDELCKSNRCFDYILEWSPFRSLYLMAKWHPQKKPLGNYNFDLFFSTFIIWTDFLLFNILLCENPMENPSKLSNREFLEFRVDCLQILKGVEIWNFPKIKVTF